MNATHKANKAKQRIRRLRRRLNEQPGADRKERLEARLNVLEAVWH